MSCFFVAKCVLSGKYQLLCVFEMATCKAKFNASAHEIDLQILRARKKLRFVCEAQQTKFHFAAASVAKKAIIIGWMALVKVTTKYCVINALMKITSWFQCYRLITAANNLDLSSKPKLQ
jgi:hypothetical protein